MREVTRDEYIKFLANRFYYDKNRSKVGIGFDYTAYAKKGGKYYIYNALKDIVISKEDDSDLIKKAEEIADDRVLISK